jgi:dTDP-4-dehydrorhamnose reductase
MEICRIVEKILVEYPTAAGLYNVSSNPISKFDLLNLIRQKMRLPVKIKPETGFICDRSLDSTRFQRDFNYSPPTWDAMIEELSLDLAKGDQNA